jgi:hypothetical protein
MCSVIKNVSKAVLIQTLMSDVIHTRHDRDKSGPPGLNKTQNKGSPRQFFLESCDPQPPSHGFGKILSYPVPWIFNPCVSMLWLLEKVLLYYTTDLNVIEVRTECPEVRIKLRLNKNKFYCWWL